MFNYYNLFKVLADQRFAENIKIGVIIDKSWTPLEYPWAGKCK